MKLPTPPAPGGFLRPRIVHALRSALGAAAVTLSLSLAAPVPAADLVWTNTAGGNWHVAANWRPNQVPGAGDTVWITNQGTYTNTLSVTSTVAGLTLGGPSGVQTLELKSAGRLILAGPGLGRTTNGVLQLSGGTLDGTGNLLLEGPVLWNAGAVRGSGQLRCGGVSRLAVGGDAHLTGRTLVQAGVLQWVNGTLNTGGGSVISNLAGATVVISNDVSIYTEGTNGPGVFYNAGILRKAAGAGGGVYSTIADVFHNTGVVEVRTGNLRFSGGGSNSGSNSVAALCRAAATGRHPQIQRRGPLRAEASESVAGKGAVICDGAQPRRNG